jgi:glycyl-tRNA synthetase beta chain
MPELLLEVGCEELPASFVRKAYEDLRKSIHDKLREAGLIGEDHASACMGTPRRLIVGIPDLPERQEDSTKDMRGPNEQAAYKDGQPSPALLGFCKGQGVGPEEVRLVDGYVWVTKKIEGRATAELLSEIIPQAIRGLQFDKSMRWGASKMRFARPIRWMLAAFDGRVVPFEIEGVQSGLTSVGHRFYRPETFQAAYLQDLVDGLRKRFVEPDPAERQEKILREAQQVASGDPQMPADLIEENVFLTEWPSALQGSFKREFQELPVPVLVTAMAKHERFFPVRDPGGKPTNHFVSIRNAGEDDTVRAGNEWVLNARFNDAKFFYDEDKQKKLADFLEETSGILFQDKLGTVRQRADRLSALAAAIARATGADDAEIQHASQAGLYCKADLSTGLVSELASLQGIVGGEYAKREGFADPVCWAIETHYDLDKNPEIACPGSRTAVRTLLADNLDKLAGYLGIGIEPSGSSDPFGLRRAVTTLIEAAWHWPSELPSYEELLKLALQEYSKQGVALKGDAALNSLANIFEGRYEAMLPDVRHDVLDAALLIEDRAKLLSPQGVRFRTAVLGELVGDTPFVQTATRPLNIVSAARKKGIPLEEKDPLGISADDLDSQTGSGLLAKLKEQGASVDGASSAKELAELLKSLQAPINDFFESTMVMADDEKARFARLSLLNACSRMLLRAGDFSKIVIEG